MDGSIASAVVLPEEALPPASPPNGIKRRQPSFSEESAKRPRLDDEDVSHGRQHHTSVAKPAAPVRRERGRERRLFGAVLGALSQAPSTTAAQKRRSEIEKRQLAQRKQESEESEQRKAERVAKRITQRWKEQRRFQEQSMQSSHENRLNMAHFLQTETTPHLYYKPWETSAEEEDRIQDQVAQAHETNRREVEEHEALQQPQANRRHTNGSHNSPKDQDMDHNHAHNSEHEAVRLEATEHASNTNVPRHETTTDHTSDDNHDENGEDVVEEAAEDTVIY
ncbi:pinin/SDK/memA/ protein conserved region-domain-containing protein [Phaeosphaeriaceae sp. PMI808]|nr:pinin/SDK/memA/ protein conserved region-domain-containing protein [Phaeosphaeriaceae sp. PMI808]